MSLPSQPVPKDRGSQKSESTSGQGFLFRRFIPSVSKARLFWGCALAVATLTSAQGLFQSGFVFVLLAAFIIAGFFVGTSTQTLRDGFAGGFLSGYIGYFVGTLVFGLVSTALSRPAISTILLGVLISAVVGLFFGLGAGVLAGSGGALGFVARRTVR